MNAAEFRAVRIAQRANELERAMETLMVEMMRWERPDVPTDISPVPFMVAYGLLSQLAADLAIAEHDPLGHRLLELSERVTTAVRHIHRAQTRGAEREPA